MERIERIAKRPVPTQAPRRWYLSTGFRLESALRLALVGVWACSSVEGTETTLEAKATLLDRAAPALSARWLPSELTRHEAALVNAAQRHGLDPALLAIVALVESVGDTLAQSPGGARGLMQLMPATAAGIAQQRQIAGHSDERLFELEYNLDLGAWYLSQQLAQFGAGRLDARAVELAAVAYNGGPELARAYAAGTASLWPETKKYSELVVALWNERQDAESQTFEAWRERVRAGR